jgi:GNAT superfamily N-acetyltransferase
VIEVRPANKSDMRFVHSSWFTDHWARAAPKHVPRALYAAEMDPRIDTLLTRGTTLVAFFPQVPDEVLGWVTFENNVVHYLYVKGAYRRQGIGKGLVPAGAAYYTFATDAPGRAFAKHANLDFNPFRSS